MRNRQIGPRFHVVRVFVGATTENPSFEVNSALLSRSTVYQLQSLKPEESEVLLERALEREFPKLSVTEDARRVMIELSDGDARRLLNAVDAVSTDIRYIPDGLPESVSA